MAITGTTLGSKSITKKAEDGGNAAAKIKEKKGGGRVEGVRGDGMFEGMRVFLELGVVSLSKKKEVVASIEAHGGAIDFVISKKTTHVVTLPELLGSYKLKSATNHGCFVVTEQFLTDSLEAGRRVDEWPYLFIGDTPAQQIGASSASYVGMLISRAFTEVSTVMDKAYEPIVNDAVFQATLNIASLCVGLGANVPSSGSFRLNTVVNNMYSNLYRKPKFPSSRVQITPAPLPSNPTPAVPQPAKSSLSSPSKPSIPTPLFREISPKPTTTTTTTSLSSPFRSSFSSSPRPSLSSPLTTRPPISTTTTSRPFSSTLPFSSAYLSSTTPFSPSLSSSATPSSSPSLSSTTSSAIPPATSSSRFSIPPATKKVSYSFAQFEEERKKKQEEEKAKRAEENGSVLREREIRRKAEEEARKREMEEKRQELLEKRRLEDEERKQKNRELSEAREKRIAEERRKREAVLEKLKQKPAHDLLTTSYFQQWDAEENAKRSEEEWKAFMKEMEEEQRKEEEKERAAQEKIDKREAEKLRKLEEMQANAEKAAAEKLVLKAQRKEEYERNRDAEKIRKKKEWEERQAKLLAEYLERQKRRELKALKGSLPKVEKIDYDNNKIFIGGIKLDDINKAKMDPKHIAKIRDERINSVLRMFEQFGEILKRKVSTVEGGVHCFITFKEEASVEKAMTIMKEADERKKLVEEAKAKFQESKLHPLCVPNANFYVRIPKAKEKKDKQKEKKSKKQEKEDAKKKPAEKKEEEDGGGEWSVAGETSKPPAQPASPQPASSSSPAPAPAAPLGRPKRVIDATVAVYEGGTLGDDATLRQFSKPAKNPNYHFLKRAEKPALAASDTSSEPDFASATAYDVLDDEELID